MGRPTKRTPELEKKLQEALSLGNTRRASAHYVGITETTFHDWMGRFPEFAASVMKAEAEAEVRNQNIIVRAAHNGTWQAAAWWLERRRPQDYARRVDVSFDARKAAEKLATDSGLDALAVLAEAEAILSSDK